MLQYYVFCADGTGHCSSVIRWVVVTFAQIMDRYVELLRVDIELDKVLDLNRGRECSRHDDPFTSGIAC
jgi:hypothetical protein